LPTYCSAIPPVSLFPLWVSTPRGQLPVPEFAGRVARSAFII
jgi:hypothetical protein